MFNPKLKCFFFVFFNLIKIGTKKKYKKIQNNYLPKFIQETRMQNYKLSNSFEKLNRLKFDVLLIIVDGKKDFAIVNMNSASSKDSVSNEDPSFYPKWLTRFDKDKFAEINPDSKKYGIFEMEFDIEELMRRVDDPDYKKNPFDQGMRFAEFAIETAHDHLRFVKCSDSFEYFAEKFDSVDLDKSGVKLIVGYKDTMNPQLFYACDKTYENAAFPNMNLYDVIPTKYTM